MFSPHSLKVLPEAAPSGHNADVNTGASGSVAATSPVCKEEAEMRAALQFLMRHMVKRAVMRSPIKRALALADLERAQAMIYKLVVNGLTEEPSGGKTKPGEFEVLGSTSLIMITRRLFLCKRSTSTIFGFSTF